MFIIGARRHSSASNAEFEQGQNTPIRCKERHSGGRKSHSNLYKVIQDADRKQEALSPRAHFRSIATEDGGEITELATMRGIDVVTFDLCFVELVAAQTGEEGPPGREQTFPVTGKKC